MRNEGDRRQNAEQNKTTAKSAKDYPKKQIKIEIEIWKQIERVREIDSGWKG
jgi:hypothetical protein